MSLGNSKGHLHGKYVMGSHTSVIENADKLVKKLVNFPWFQAVRPKEIKVARGGSTSVTLKRHTDSIRQDTLTLTFRQPGTVQELDIKVSSTDNAEDIAKDIQATVSKTLKGATFYNRL